MRSTPRREVVRVAGAAMSGSRCGWMAPVACVRSATAARASSKDATKAQVTGAASHSTSYLSYSRRSTYPRSQRGSCSFTVESEIRQRDPPRAITSSAAIVVRAVLSLTCQDFGPTRSTSNCRGSVPMPQNVGGKGDFTLASIRRCADSPRAGVNTIRLTCHLCEVNVKGKSGHRRWGGRFIAGPAVGFSVLIRAGGVA